MDKITINGNLPEQLQQVKEKAAVYDEAGNLIGYFVSINRLNALEQERKAMYDWAKSQITDEELDAAENDPIEYTTEEAMKLLEDR
jgi:phage portal protein BeeE